MSQTLECTFKSNFFALWSTSLGFSESFQKQQPEVSIQKGVLKNFTKFTGKHLCWSLSFRKVACLRSATLFKKKKNQHKFFFFLVKLSKFLGTPSLTEHPRATASVNYYLLWKETALNSFSFSDDLEDIQTYNTQNWREFVNDISE